MNYWIGVATLDHLERGFEKGMFGIGHGKKAPLEMMKGGDRIVFYLPKKDYGVSSTENKYQRFRGFAVIDDGEVFSETVGDGCKFRKKLTFLDMEKEVAIAPLIGKLSFIKDTKRWGFPFMKGYIKITKEDWNVIENGSVERT
ncbi:MAG: EVE domain-containing protein [Candidatus Gracilibacteria bacterium]